MSRTEVGIEDARKVLGDLVTAAQQGQDIVITRNSRPVARIVAYREDAMNDKNRIDYAGPTGRELPGEHWNARILRERAEATRRDAQRDNTEA